MTIIHMNLREPLRKFKLAYGVILAVAGIARVVAANLAEAPTHSIT